MRGAWLVLCACALSLAHAGRDMSEIRVTPMPGDHELNAKWLEDFRQDLLRDAYDDETSPKLPSSTPRTIASLVYRTHSPATTADATGADHTSEKVTLPVLRSLGAVSSKRTIDRTPAQSRDDDVGHSSGEPGPPRDASFRFRAASAEDAVGQRPGAPLLGCLSASAEHSTPGPQPDASVRRRPALANIAAGNRPGRLPQDAQSGPLVERLSGRPPARHLPDDASVEHSTLGRPIVGHTSGEPGPPPDASIMHNRANIAAGHRPGRLPQDAQSGPLVERFSGRPSARRRSPDDASVQHLTQGRPIVGHMSGKPPTRSPDDAASRELGISRRDLYGGRRHGSIELDARRQPFLKSVRELDDQMIPVVIPHANNDNQQGHARKSGKRLWHANSEYEDKPPFIMDQNGVKRYRVHTDARERFFNQFGGDEPGLREEWGFPDFDREMRLKENRNQQRGDENLAQNDDDQESREESGSKDEGISVSSSNELNVSEYHQENVRSRYVQDERPEREYAQRFSARRDAALLADGLASSKKPCNCETEHPPIVPDL